MILCFCLSGLMECQSCKALIVGGGGNAFCKSEFLTFKIHHVSCFQGHVSCQKFTLLSGLYVYSAQV